MLTCIVLCLSLNPGQKALIRAVLLHNVYALITPLPKPNVPRSTKNSRQHSLAAASSVRPHRQEEQQTLREKEGRGGTHAAKCGEPGVLSERAGEHCYVKQHRYFI